MIIRLLKKLAGIRSPLRPPGAIEEELFDKTCIRCRKCAEVCPYDSIQIAHGEWGLKMGSPFVIPRETPCYLCMKCPPVCPTGALKADVTKEEVKMGRAFIDEDRCLPYQGIICRACYERCPIYREAIILQQEVYPVVIEDKCVGCGICENVCLADPPAIVVSRLQEVGE